MEKKFVIRFMEHMEVGLAEDACLVEYEDEVPSEHPEFNMEFDDFPAVDQLVSKLHNDLVKDELLNT